MILGIFIFLEMIDFGHFNGEILKTVFILKTLINLFGKCLVST